MTEDARDGDPHERLRALQRRAFAADGDAAGDSSVARAMRDLRAQIAADAEPATASAEEPAAPDPADGDPDPYPRRRLPLGATLAGVLTIGVLLGGAASAAIHPDLPAPAPTADSAAAAGEPALAAQVFTRLQTVKDVPLVPMPDTFAAASFRYLGSAGWTDGDADGVIDSPYYAARSTSNLICLVVVPEGSGYLSTCAPETDYPPAGLRLSWQSTDLHPGVPDGTTGMVLDVTVAWLSDSTVETRGSGRPVPIP